MAVKPLWNSPPQFVDANGDPYSGALLFFYVAGSSTKQDTFTNSGGGTPCDNPITLNSSGYPAVSGTIVAPWGTVGQTYKIGLAIPGSSDPPNSFIWTEDNVSPLNDTTVAIDQWVAGPAPTYISGTSFSLVGDQTSTFQVGRRVKTTNSGGTIYSTISASAYTSLTTITVVNDSGTLDSGLSAVSYGLISATNPSHPPFGQVIYCSGASGTNTVTASAAVEAAGYRTGQVFCLIPANTNTGATTWNINGLGAKNVFSGGAACVGNEMQAGVPYCAMYDGTQLNLLGQAELSGSFVPVVLSGGNQTGRTYGAQVGRYVRNGSLVNFWLTVSLTATGSSTGDTTIAALPFTAANVSGLSRAVSVVADDLAGGVTTAVGGYVNNNASTLTIGSYAAGQFTTLQETGLSATSTFFVSGSYHI